ncbi:hypothetical protein VT03_02860 [Planctomyces sp. SH-PL14]|nr:hypothetical protein VT03_02860 [Planctomyces sp. SH-PL14]
MGDNVGKLSFRMAQGVLSVDFCGDSDLGQRAAGPPGVPLAARLVMPFLSGASDDRFDPSAALMSLKSLSIRVSNLAGWVVAAAAARNGVQTVDVLPFPARRGEGGTSLLKDLPVPDCSDLSLGQCRPSPRSVRILWALLAVLIAAAPARAIAESAAAPPEIANEDWGKKNNFPMTKAAKESNPAGASKDLLINGAKFYVDRMTIPENQAALVTKTDQYFNNYIYGPGTSKAAEAILHQATIDRCKELLERNPPHPPVVTVNLVGVLSRLVAAKPNLTKGTPAVPLVATADPLIAVLDSAVLPVETKIRAAKALGTIGLNAVNGVPGGDLAITKRDAIVGALVRGLKSKAAEGMTVGPCWYREALVEAIGSCDLPMTLAGGSDPIDALMDRMVDRKENTKVRAAAVRATSQLSLNGSFNVPLIVHETAIVAFHLGHEYNTTLPAKRSGAFKWSAAYLYFSFKPENPQTALAPKLWGFLQVSQRPGLAAQKPLVDAAYAACKPILTTLLNPANPAVVPVVDLNTALEWLEKNAPANRKVTAKSPAIPDPKTRGAYETGPPAANVPATPAAGPMAAQQAGGG